MALINLAAREIHGKIVYHGPGLGGKTTNLRYLHERIPARRRGELRSIESESGRTLFFDFMPLDLGSVHGFTIRFHLYTVAGQDGSEGARFAVLNGADGVVFVADARRERLEANRQSLDELGRHLARQGKQVLDYPVVMQYNKMDLADALAPSRLDEDVNMIGAPRFEASALTGVGVVETLRAICRLVTKTL